MKDLPWKELTFFDVGKDQDTLIIEAKPILADASFDTPFGITTQSEIAGCDVRDCWIIKGDDGEAVNYEDYGITKEDIINELMERYF